MKEMYARMQWFPPGPQQEYQILCQLCGFQATMSLAIEWGGRCHNDTSRELLYTRSTSHSSNVNQHETICIMKITLFSLIWHRNQLYNYDPELWCLSSFEMIRYQTYMDQVYVLDEWELHSFICYPHSLSHKQKHRFYLVQNNGYIFEVKKSGLHIYDPTTK
jgi:hypothetical protein